jgi:hypothetical protein
VAADKNSVARQDRPSWLDRVLGTASPPFTFRRGGSAVTGGIANDSEAQQSGSGAAPNEKLKGRQRG